MGPCSIFFGLSVYGYLLAALAYAVWFPLRRRALGAAGTALLGLGLASQIVFVTARGIAFARPPMANVFESLVFMAACLAGGSLLAVRREGWRPLAPPAALAALAVTLVAQMMAPDEVEPLVPALRNSLWLTVHVAFCMTSYAAFGLTYIAALACLVRSDGHRAWAGLVVAATIALVVTVAAVAGLREALLVGCSRGEVLLSAAGGCVLLAVLLWPALGVLAGRLGVVERLPDAESLERATYGAAAFGFPFLTLGIATGAYWADQAWGRYWGWDDKEVAALVTWLVFVIYLHVRLDPKRRGPWTAWIAVAGFWSVLFTYFGVTYLLSGLHAYG